MVKLTIKEIKKSIKWFRERPIMFPGIYNIAFESNKALNRPMNLNTMTKADVTELVRVMSKVGVTPKEAEKAFLALKSEDSWIKKLRLKIFNHG